MSIRLNGLEVAWGKDLLRNGTKAYTANGYPQSSRNGILDRGINWNGNRFLPPLFDPVLYLPGYPGQGSTIHDFSGDTNHGSITGAIWRRLANGVSYLYFDGSDDFVDCGNDAELDVRDFTVVAWVNPITDVVGCVMSKDHTIGRAWTCVIADDGTLDFYGEGGAGQSNSTGTVTDNIWQMIAWAIDDGNNLTYYKNDSNIGGDASIPALTAHVNTKVYVGGRQFTGSLIPFHGSIALPRLIPTTLTQPQIANIFHRERHLFGV